MTKKGTTSFDTDEHPRQGLTMADLAKLTPVFVKEGTVTAGNSSSINDGAAALVMMSLTKANDVGIEPLARVVATGSAAVDAKIMGMGVVPSVRRALLFANLPIEAIDYWEINEAFAAQIPGMQPRIADSFGQDERQWRRDRNRPPRGHDRGTAHCLPHP